MRNQREIVIEMVARLAASPSPNAQQEAVRLAQRYRAVIASTPAPWPDAGTELAVEAMGAVIP